jgi:acetyltransferase-like isoleucine patch superfamily enzyme
MGDGRHRLAWKNGVGHCDGVAGEVMRLYDFVPDALKDYVRLLARKRQFRDSIVSSPLVSGGAVLGHGCGISRNVEIAAGVQIGDYTYVNAGSIIASGRIGKYCSIGYFCQVGMPEHPLSYMSTSPRLYGGGNLFGLPGCWDNYRRPPSIGNDVWIASHVVVLQGVKIGDGAVIGAGAVVTKDVEPYAIYCGVPARLVRKRFSDDDINARLGWHWWDSSEDDLQEHSEAFRTVYPNWPTIPKTPMP